QERRSSDLRRADGVLDTAHAAGHVLAFQPERFIHRRSRWRAETRSLSRAPQRPARQARPDGGLRTVWAVVPAAGGTGRRPTHGFAPRRKRAGVPRAPAGWGGVPRAARGGGHGHQSIRSPPAAVCWTARTTGFSFLRPRRLASVRRSAGRGGGRRAERARIGGPAPRG